MPIDRQLETGLSVDTTFAAVGSVFSADSADGSIFTTQAANSSSSGSVDFELQGRILSGGSGVGWTLVEDWTAIGTSDEPATAVGDPEFDQYRWRARIDSGTGTVDIAFRLKDRS